MPELQELAPEGERRMSANPHANGGLLRKPLDLPDFRDYAVEARQARHSDSLADGTRSRQVPARRDARNMTNFRVFGPDENASNKLAGRLRGEQEDLAGGISNPRTPTAASSLPTAA